MNLPNIDVSQEQWNEIRKILQTYVSGYQILAFGSRATWKAKNYSDLDLVIITDNPLSISLFATIEEAFDESILPYKVDIVDWASTSESFQKIISAEAVEIQSENPSLENHWQVVKIEDIAAIKKGAIAIGPFGSRLKSHEYTTEGIPVIRGKNIVKSINFSDGFVYISKEKANQLGTANVYKNDLVFPHRGSIGEVGIVTDNKRYVISSSLMKLTCDYTKVIPMYLYYFFKSHTGHHELLKNASQVGTPGIGQPLSSLKSITLKLPPLTTQEQIVKTLVDLDNKIELNRQTNQTLEHIAQAIFKSWFVDFEPVKAKIKAKNALTLALSQKEREQKSPLPLGEDLGEGETAQDIIERAAMCAISGKTDAELDQLDTETQQQLKTTAALFPDTWVDSELGEIPEGWEVKSLDEIAHYQNGLALQKFRPEDGEASLPVLKISQLKKGFADGAEKAKSSIKPECIVNNGDIVFSWSGSLMVDLWCGGKVALNQHLFKVTSKDYPKWFYYNWTKHHLKAFQQIAADKAVTMGHIKREHLSQAKCIIPALKLDGITLLNDLLEKQIEQKIEVFTLQELRDTLLPKLLSGELSTQAIKTTLSEAVV